MLLVGVLILVLGHADPNPLGWVGVQEMYGDARLRSHGRKGVPTYVWVSSSNPHHSP